MAVYRGEGAGSCAVRDDGMRRCVVSNPSRERHELRSPTHFHDDIFFLSSPDVLQKIPSRQRGKSDKEKRVFAERAMVEYERVGVAVSLGVLV